LDQAGLAHLESLTAVRFLVDRPLTGSGGLVWCLLAREVDRLGPSYLLGRLTEQIHPRRIEILVFPDAWADAGRAGWLEEVGRCRPPGQDSERLRRGLDLAGRACGLLAVEIHEVCGEDNLAGSFTAKGQRVSIWGSMAHRLMNGGSP
jgi:hypothetical protein